VEGAAGVVKLRNSDRRRLNKFSFQPAGES
jgi:hypothetical protein